MAQIGNVMPPAASFERWYMRCKMQEELVRQSLEEAKQEAAEPNAANKKKKKKKKKKTLPDPVLVVLPALPTPGAVAGSGSNSAEWIDQGLITDLTRGSMEEHHAIAVSLLGRQRVLLNFQVACFS